MRDLESPRVMVVDLGFGDAGKGTVTDWLVRDLSARAVVRFNGSAQAGHNVVAPDGRHHTFAQFGSGTFVPGVLTFLSKHVLLHPTALLVEARHLEAIGVPDPLDWIVVSEDCLVTTPLHQAATCVRELARGDARHGSCGVGIGETMRDALASPADVIRARDLRDPPQLLRLLTRLQREKREELEAELRSLPRTDVALAQRTALEDPAVITTWIEQTRALAARPVIQDDRSLHALLQAPGAVVFEGAQGVLLDEWSGFHPFTTWSTCTFDNALSLLREHDAHGEHVRFGVLRSFATRHGAGPFPTESVDVPAGRTAEHNDAGPWQGHFRTGFLDSVLLRYALAVCGGVDGLAVTHLDRFRDGDAWRIATSYEVDAAFDPLVIRRNGVARDLAVGSPRDLDHVEALGRALFAVRPIYGAPDRCSNHPSSIVAAVEELTGFPVTLTSYGPTAREKVATSPRAWPPSG